MTNIDIRQLRKKTGMTQDEFSNYFGIPLSTYVKWEQGVYLPPDYILRMIHKILLLEGRI